MRYKYRKSMYVIQAVMAAAFSYGLIFCMNNDANWNRKMIITITGFLAVFLSLYSGEYFKRYVEFGEEYVTFNSYRIAKKVRYLNVKYEDILSLEAMMIPFLGIYKVNVKAKNIQWIIPVTYCISKHNEMYARLCSNARKGNPNIYVDERLIKHLKKKGYYETD